MATVGDRITYNSTLNPSNASPSYLWTISGGGSFYGSNTSSSAIIDWTDVGTFTVTCTCTNGCSTISNTTTVNVVSSSYNYTHTFEYCDNFTKNDCGVNCTGNTVQVCRTVSETRYSNVSQQDATDAAVAAAVASAIALVNNEGQNEANTSSSCNCSYTYTHTAEVCEDFIKNDCEVGCTGSTVNYCQSANGTGDSNVSQQEATDNAVAIATNNAQILVNNGGQAYANANGTCTNCPQTEFTNTNNAFFESTVAYVKNNCDPGCTGESVNYYASSTVPADSVTGPTQIDANYNALALAESNVAADQSANGQTYANTNGTCTCPCTPNWQSADPIETSCGDAIATHSTYPQSGLDSCGYYIREEDGCGNSRWTYAFLGEGCVGCCVLPPTFSSTINMGGGNGYGVIYHYNSNTTYPMHFDYSPGTSYTGAGTAAQTIAAGYTSGSPIEYNFPSPLNLQVGDTVTIRYWLGSFDYQTCFADVTYTVAN